MYNPKVSIIIPVYNGSNYLKEAIESALNQTYKNLEILVINDGSNDNGATDTVALYFGDKIKYYQKKNGGVASALNYGIEKMSGEYFSWLSHDDLYYKNKIEEQINFISKLKDKDIIISSDIEMIDNKGKHLFFYNISYNNDNFLYKTLINGMINGCSLLIPKKVFNDIGIFNEKLKTTQDYEMWFRIAKKYNFIHLNKVLIKSRQHMQQDSKSKKVLCKKERKDLEKYVLNLYKTVDLKYGKLEKLPNILFKVYLKLILFIRNNELIMKIYNYIK